MDIDADNAAASTEGTAPFKVPHKVPTLDVVPEELHAQYTQTPDGQYEFRNAAGLTTALKKERESRALAEKNASKFKKGLYGLVGDEIDLAEIDFDDESAVSKLVDRIVSKKKPAQRTSTEDETSKQQAIQQALAEAEGEWKKKVAKVNTLLSEKETSYAELEKAYLSDIMTFAVDHALSRESLNSEGRELLPNRIKQDLIVLKEGGKFVVRVKALDPDSELPYRLNAKGTAMTVEELVEKLKPNFPSLFTVQAPAPGITGTVMGQFKTDNSGITKIPRSRLEKDPNLYRKLRSEGVNIQIIDG